MQYYLSKEANQVPTIQEFYCVYLGVVVIACVHYGRTLSDRRFPKRYASRIYWILRATLALSAPFVAHIFSIAGAGVLFIFGFAYISILRVLEREVHKIAEKLARKMAGGDWQEFSDDGKIDDEQMKSRKVG